MGGVGGRWGSASAARPPVAGPLGPALPLGAQEMACMTCGWAAVDSRAILGTTACSGRQKTVLVQYLRRSIDPETSAVQ